MNRSRPAPATVALLMGLGALTLLLGALAFQYWDGLPPCEICLWQRYPHIVAAAAGIGGFLLVRADVLPEGAGSVLVVLAGILLASSGAIGVYHAGLEWGLWKGPQACTGPLFHYAGGPLDLSAPVVRCDKAAWRFLGISLAGYNAILSLGLASAGFVLAGARMRMR